MMPSSLSAADAGYLVCSGVAAAGLSLQPLPSYVNTPPPPRHSNLFYFLPRDPPPAQMLGIWCVVVWQQLGCPATLQLVELGPGRGTLMADLLRGTAAFKPFVDSLQVILAECDTSMHLYVLLMCSLCCDVVAVWLWLHLSC
jgi:hypothetical protein